MGCVISMKGGRHDATERLLPWYVSGRISAEDAATVEAHLGDCAQCREDLVEERRIAEHLPSISLSAEEGWLRLQARLAGERSPSAVPAAASDYTRWYRRPRIVGAALAAQAACILLLAGFGTIRPAPQEYRALSAGASPNGDLLVMFGPVVTERQMRSILFRHNARIVDGPTSTGAYILALDGPDARRRILMIRAQPGVALAETLGPGTNR